MQIRTSNENAAEEFYRNAKREVESSKYSGEIAWQQSQCVSEISETDFLRESAWVIINSGFRESVARKCFGHISLSFHDWRSAEEIASDAETCISLALEGFSNVKKINAIGAVAQRVNGEGFDLVKSCTQISHELPLYRTNNSLASGKEFGVRSCKAGQAFSSPC